MGEKWSDALWVKWQEMNKEHYIKLQKENAGSVVFLFLPFPLNF